MTLKIVAIIIVMVFLDLLFLAMFCRISRMVERIKSKDAKKDSALTTVEDRKPLIRRIYSYFNSYCYGWMRYSVLCIGRFPSCRIRNLIMRHVFCMQITRKSVLYGGSEFRSPWNIKMGNCVVSNNCLFDGRSGISIADNVVFGVGVRLWTAEHAVNDPMFRVLDENRQPIVIDERAWICSDSTILPGVHIGKGAVIASRACVTKDCEPYGIYAGIPAKKIGERNHDLVYGLPGKQTWHFY